MVSSSLMKRDGAIDEKVVTMLTVMPI